MAPRREGSHSPVKTLYQILQCLHHLSLLVSEQEGAGCSSKAFRKKVIELDRFIRPAIPNSAIFEAVKEANRAWATSVTQALIAHYRAQLDFLKGSLKAWKISYADRALYRNKALQWARWNFGRKISKSTIDHLDRILADFCTPSVKIPENARDRNASAGTKQANVATARQQATGSGQRERVLPSTPRKRARPSLSPQQSQMPKRACTPQKSLQNRTAPIPTQPAPQTSRPTSYASAARSPPSEPIRPPSCRNLFNTHPSVNRFERLGKEHRGNKIHEKWEIPRVEKNILILGTSNLSRISEVKRRDAQIACYPGLKLDQLLRLLQGFKYGSGSQNPGLKPSKVVLMVGLNDRGLSPNTNETNMKKVVSEATRVFPGSKIHILLNAFSNTLSFNEKQTLKKLNEVITLSCSNKEDVDFIPPIPQSKFEIARGDNIHWTERCANATIDHVFHHLN